MKALVLMLGRCPLAIVYFMPCTTVFCSHDQAVSRLAAPP